MLLKHKVAHKSFSKANLIVLLRHGVTSIPPEIHAGPVGTTLGLFCILNVCSSLQIELFFSVC